MAEGGAREAAIRALVYIGMGGAGVDERAFNELREIRAENAGLTLQAFKQLLREQYFSLMLDREGALDAIPKMLPSDAASRTRISCPAPHGATKPQSSQGSQWHRARVAMGKW